MKSRSMKSRFAVVVAIVAVILGGLLIKLGATQLRSERRQWNSATDEFDKLFVNGVRESAASEGADTATASATNQFFDGSAAPRQAGDSRSGLGSQMQANSLPYEVPQQVKDSTGLVKLPSEVPAALSGATK